MNIFVLNTGRCGSMTFYKACLHITNFTAGHQSRSHLIGTEHFNYPDNHIEIDNRLSWFLGCLPVNAFYIHLRKKDTEQSLLKRYNSGIVNAYKNIILMNFKGKPGELVKDYCRTIDMNIKQFIKNKSSMDVEFGKEDFQRFWITIGAIGNIDKALKEFDIKYNSAEQFENNIYHKIANGIVHYEISYKFIGIASIMGIWALNVHAWVGAFWGVVSIPVAIFIFIMLARFYKKYILPEVLKIYSLTNPIMRSIYERNK